MDGGVGEVDCGVHREIGGGEDQREFERRLNFWAPLETYWKNGWALTENTLEDYSENI